MKKEEFIALGLTEELAAKAAKASEEELKGYMTKSEFAAEQQAKAQLEKEVKERDKQLEELKKSGGDNAQLKQQIETLQQQNTEQQKAYEAELKQLKLDNAIDAALTAAGARNVKAVRGLFDESKLKLADDGSVEGFKEQLTAVQKSDSYLFVEKQPVQQNFKGFQPGASGDIKPGTKVDTSKMTYSELAAYLATNPDAKIE